MFAVTKTGHEALAGSLTRTGQHCSMSRMVGLGMSPVCLGTGWEVWSVLGVCGGHGGQYG